MGKTHIIQLPPVLSFKNNTIVDFNKYLETFHWDIPSNVEKVIIDGRRCQNANYQALSLLVLYAWKLKVDGYHIDFRFPNNQNYNLGHMWKRLGGYGCFNVLNNSTDNFKYMYDKPLFAIRNSKDAKEALSAIVSYLDDVDLNFLKGHESILSYILNEILYNTMEHGYNTLIPSLLQANWYKDKGQFSFIIADLGIGIKRHLAQSYPALESDEVALLKSIEPEVSGTFEATKPSYSSLNNAGMGLFISSNLAKRLKAHMYIVSGNGLLHISPNDITTDTLRVQWPGTFIYVTLGFTELSKMILSDELSELRKIAKNEINTRENKSKEAEVYIDMHNYFMPRCEVKSEAIHIRDTKIMPALKEQKKVILDFTNIKLATHSFLVALLGQAISALKLKSYKYIKITGANAEIRETIDFIFDSYSE